MASRFSWLTSEFLETILKSSENSQNVKVNDFMLHDAVPKGENYGSYLMRVTVNFTEDNISKQKSFVIKTTLESDEWNEKLKKCGVFDREIAFYRDITPNFKKYAGLIEKDFMCAPRCYATSDNPTYIVFEDLKIQNYRTVDRRIGLDYTATALLLRKLAKMHAINAMLYDESPELFESHKVRLVSKENTELLSAFTNGMQDIKTFCLKWPGYEHFHEKFDPLLKDVLEVVESVYTKDDNTFNTLIHGDMWTNNIMYKFDETNNPIDVRMVDFQCGYYAPPAIDVCNILYTSTSNELLEQDWDRLLRIYHTELVASLKSINYPNDRIPSLNELQIQMLKKSLVAVMVSLTAIPMRQISSEAEPDIDTVLSDKARQQRIELIEKPIVIERLGYLLDFYDRKGFFERQT